MTVILCRKVFRYFVNYQRCFHGSYPILSQAESDVKYIQIKKLLSEDFKLAYKKTTGSNYMGIVYIPGFMSAMNGTKATALHSFCQRRDISYIRYDPTGFGKTVSSVELKDARFSHWLQDARLILNEVADQPQLLIGSSMGAWISLIIAQEFPEKVQGLLLLAPAVNFAKGYFDFLKTSLPATVRQKLEQGGTFEYYDKNYGSLPLSYGLFKDMMHYDLSLEQNGINVTAPVKILHGMKDTDVPYLNSLDLPKALKSSDVALTFLKDADHSLSSGGSLKIIQETILSFLSLDLHS